MSGATSDPITSFLTLGEPAYDPIKEPAVDSAGKVVPEPDESVLWSGQAQVSVMVHGETSSWRGKRRAWLPVMEPKSSAAVALTTRRVQLLWPDWRKDSSLGSFFERRVTMAAMERGMGRQVLGGHIRHRWIGAVSTSKSRDRQKIGRVRLDIAHAGTAYAVTIAGFKRDEEQTIGLKLVSAIAAEQLGDGRALRDETRSTLEAMLTAPQAEDVGWGQRYGLPGVISVGR